MNKIKQIILLSLLFWANNNYAVTVETTANLNENHGDGSADSFYQSYSEA